MSKDKISQYDANAANNTDVNGTNIAEGCAPSGINNAIREVMAALKRFETGSDGDSITVGGNLVVSGSTTANTFTAGVINATTVDTTNIEVTNIKAKDGTAAATIADSTGVFTHSTATVFPAGAVGTPSITTAGDLNTGIFFPAADTIAFAENGVEAMRIDSSGNLLVGTTTAIGKLTVQGASDIRITVNESGSSVRTDIISQTTQGQIGTVSNHPLDLITNGTGRARITNDGNLLLNGTVVANTTGGLTANNSFSGSVATQISLRNSATANGSGSQISFRGVSNAAAEHDYGYVTVVADDTTAKTGSMRFSTTGGSSPVERMRIDSSGNVLVGTTSNTANYKTNIQFDGSGVNGLYLQQTNASAGDPAFISCNDSQTLNNTSDAVSYTDPGAQRWSLKKNGGLYNYQGNDSNLSDRREKTNFAPAKNYLDIICAIPVQTFNYIDQSEEDSGLTLGVVAQDVQVVAPELVVESNWGTKDEPKMRLSIYQTDLQYALMKCIQELKAELDTVKAELNQLKGV